MADIKSWMTGSASTTAVEHPDKIFGRLNEELDRLEKTLPKDISLDRTRVLVWLLQASVAYEHAESMEKKR